MHKLNTTLTLIAAVSFATFEAPAAPLPPLGASPAAPLNATGMPGWEPFNGAKFTTTTEGTRFVAKSVVSAGSGDRGAYQAGVEFSEGVISVDLKGANQPGGSFLGVVFHGVDGGAYDALCFRPFNFGQADAARRGHAVQYMSHPQWPWNRLRNERPGRYESTVTPEPKPDEWFHARIEVKGKRVRVFVNGADEPCLEVDTLGDRTGGRVGLWFNGVASFANFKVEPAR